MPRDDQLIEKGISFRFLVFLCEDPLHRDLVSVGVGWHSEVAAAGWNARVLVQVLFAVEDVALSVLLTDVVSTDCAYRHGVFRVDNDVNGGERALLDLHSEFPDVFTLLDVIDLADNIPGSESIGAVHGAHNDCDSWECRAEHQRQLGHVKVGGSSNTPSSQTVHSLSVHELGLKNAAFEGAVGNHCVEEGDLLHLANVILVGFIEPCEVLALKFRGELVVLINGSILDLVHLVKLAFKEDKLFSSFGLGVDDALLVLLESVDDLHEIALLEEEAEVLRFSLFYIARQRRGGEGLFNACRHC